MLPTRHHFCPSTSSPPSYPPPSEPLAAAAALSESLVIAIMRVCSYLRGFYNLLSSVSAPYLCRCCVHQTCQSLVFYPHFNGFFHCCWMNCWIQPLSDVFVPESRASVTTAPHVLLKCDSFRGTHSGSWCLRSHSLRNELEEDPQYFSQVQVQLNCC